jgi:hypothetical protein
MEEPITDEQVWAQATKVHGLSGLSNEEFEILKLGMAENPGEVEATIERSNRANGPASYFAGVLRQKIRDGWPMPAPNAGELPASAKLRKRAENIVRNTARSEVWDSRPEWAAYVTEELAEISVQDVRLEPDEIQALIAAYDGPVTKEQHDSARKEREERIEEATEGLPALSVEENQRRMKHLRHRMLIKSAGGEIDDDDPEQWGSLAAIYLNDPVGRAMHETELRRIEAGT